MQHKLSQGKVHFVNTKHGGTYQLLGSKRLNFKFCGNRRGVPDHSLPLWR